MICCATRRRKESSVILQCIRYIVKSNFLQPTNHHPAHDDHAGSQPAEVKEDEQPVERKDEEDVSSASEKMGKVRAKEAKETHARNNEAQGSGRRT